MKLVIKDNKVLATHDDNQNVESLYEGCAFVIDDCFSGKVGDKYEITEALRQELFEKDFFQTSLGFVRRKVLMKTGETKDFLFDIKPTLKIDIPILTYNQDGTQNINVLVTQAFLDECDKQIYFDFYGALPNAVV